MNTTTLTLAGAQLDQLRPGDRIVAVDGHTLPRVREVAAALAPTTPASVARTIHGHTVTRPAGPPAVRLVNPIGQSIWNLYPDSVQTVTIERETPESDPPAPEPDPVPEPPAKRKRRAVSRRHGVVLARRGRDGWFTEDGRFEVREEYELLTECENPHPVRIGSYLREKITAELRQGHYAYACGVFGQAAVDAVRAGRRGYHCEGGREHHYTAWNIWDHEHGDYLSGTNCAAYGTFADAARALAGYPWPEG